MSMTLYVVLQPQSVPDRHLVQAVYSDVKLAQQFVEATKRLPLFVRSIPVEFDMKPHDPVWVAMRFDKPADLFFFGGLFETRDEAARAAGTGGSPFPQELDRKIP